MVGVFFFSAEPGSRPFIEPGTSKTHEFVSLSLAPARYLPARPNLPRPHHDDDCGDRDGSYEEGMWSWQRVAIVMHNSNASLAVNVVFRREILRVWDMLTSSHTLGQWSREVVMGNADSGLRKARAQAEAAERDLKLTERTAAAALERAQRAKRTLKKAKKESKKATKAARKARKAADAATKTFTKATARVTRAEAQMSATPKGKKKGVAVAAATNSAATKSAAKKAVSTRDGSTLVVPKKTTSQRHVRRVAVARAAKRPRHVSPTAAPATEPAISTVEPLGESETFVLGEPALN
jgi:hypothetical protein